MTGLQLLFIISWLVLLVFSAFSIVKARKLKSSPKFFLSVLIIVTPVLGSLITIAMLFVEHDMFWQNSATKDDTWIARSEMNDLSSGDNE